MFQLIQLTLKCRKIGVIELRSGQIGNKEIHESGQECQREDWGRQKDKCSPVQITELRMKGRRSLVAWIETLILDK